MTLLGRDVERDTLRALLDDGSARRGRALCICGPPGIGKTALLESTMAAARGWRVFHLRASRGRSVFAYSGLAELIASSPPDAPQGFGHVALILDDAHGQGSETPPPDPLAMGASVLAVLTRAAEHQPVLLAVDDVQWLDAASADALAFVARRIEGDAIVMLFARRDGESGGLEPDGIGVLELMGLSDAAAVELATARVEPGVARQVADAAAGNPLAIIEGCRLLSDAQRRGWEPINRPLSVPAELERGYAGRLDAMPRSVQLAVLVVACDERLDERLVAASCRTLGVADADSAVAGAREDGLLRESSWGLSLDHPLLGSAVYGTVDDETRRAAHAAIASILQRDGDAERRAWHLAHACDGPDESTAKLLDEAGERAQRRGDASSAAACFVRARALSESAPAGRVRLVAAADAFSAAGRLNDALTAYDEAIALADDDPTRVDLFIRRSVPGTLMGGAGRLVDEMRAEVERLRAVDPKGAATLAVYAVFPAFLNGEVSTASALLETARELDPEPDPAIDLVASGLEASVWAYQGDTERALPTVRRIVGTPGVEELWSYTPYVANILTYVDDFSRAERALDAILELWRTRGAPGALPYALISRAELRCRISRFMDARADADEAYQLAVAASRSPEIAYALCAGARAEACLGRGDAARAMAREAVDIAERNDFGSIKLWAHGALGFVELADGRVDDALPPFERCSALAARFGVRLVCTVPWGPDLVEAYLRSGRRNLAVALVDRLEEDAGLRPSVWTQGALGRCRGLVAGDDFDAEFETALLAYAKLPTPFESARTHLCYGERLRRARRSRDAAVQLEHAAAIFEGLHAPKWRERADAELGLRSATRPGRALEELTPREYQAARAVVAGATSRAAAASLFISTRTLDHHLANVYRKLGVRSRTQLAKVFREFEPDAEGDLEIP